LHSHQRPKCEVHESHVFVVLYEFVAPVAPAAVRGGVGAPIEARELLIFMGDRYVITVHPEPLTAVTLAAERWSGVPGLERDAASYLSYLIMDAAVDTYFPVIECLSDRLDILEDDIMEGRDDAVLSAIMGLKKQTLGVRKLITPLRDIFMVFLRGPGSEFGHKTFAYYQDVLDHLLRVSDSLDMHRDILASAVDLYMSTVSNRTNETMKKLTVLSTVLMTCALIAGIFGMNFKHMPELEYRYGYYGALWMMAGTSAVLAALFRWRRYI
jgi:magnesium transporter